MDMFLLFYLPKVDNSDMDDRRFTGRPWAHELDLARRHMLIGGDVEGIEANLVRAMDEVISSRDVNDVCACMTAIIDIPGLFRWFMDTGKDLAVHMINQAFDRQEMALNMQYQLEENKYPKEFVDYFGRDRMTEWQNVTVDEAREWGRSVTLKNIQDRFLQLDSWRRTWELEQRRRRRDNKEQYTSQIEMINARRIRMVSCVERAITQYMQRWRKGRYKSKASSSGNIRVQKRDASRRVQKHVKRM